jgi:hypothetical protein
MKVRCSDHECFLTGRGYDDFETQECIRGYSWVLELLGGLLGGIGFVTMSLSYLFTADEIGSAVAPSGGIELSAKP